MLRALLAATALAALPVAAFDLEKTVDKYLDKQSAAWKREQIEQLGKDRDPRKRVEAAEWLTHQNDPESIAALAGALSDPEGAVRQAAASGLWSAGEKAASFKPQLAKALDDPDANVVAYAAGALQAMGTKEAELAPARKRVLASSDANITSRFYAARNLVGYEQPQKLLEPMLAYLERNARGYTGRSTDPQERNVRLVENALGHLVKESRDRALIVPLVEELERAKAGQTVLIKTLGYFEPKPAGWTRTLLRQLESPDPRVRHAALGQLRSVKNEQDVALFVPRAGAMLRDPDASVRSEALWVLGGAGGLAASETDRVVTALSDPDESVRRNAARALGEMGDAKQAVDAAAKARVAKAARPALFAAMEKDADGDVREAAKRSLAQIGAAAGGDAMGASAAPTAKAAAGGSSADALALLRARKVTFEESSFFQALQQGDVELVRAFLDAGMSPKGPLVGLGAPIRVMLFSGSACSARERPTKAGTVEITRLLLERGADPNEADPAGNTPLMEAASKGCDRAYMKMLIKSGARIDATNAAKLTPFEMGLYSGSDGLEELIAAGYRLPPEKAKSYAEGYKDKPASLALIRKASAPKK